MLLCHVSDSLQTGHEARLESPVQWLWPKYYSHLNHKFLWSIRNAFYFYCNQIFTVYFYFKRAYYWYILNVKTLGYACFLVSYPTWSRWIKTSFSKKRLNWTLIFKKNILLVGVLPFKNNVPPQKRNKSSDLFWCYWRLWRESMYRSYSSQQAMDAAVSKSQSTHRRPSLHAALPPRWSQSRRRSTFRVQCYGLRL